MSEFVFRKATTNDIPFIVNTIVEAEKSGTDRLSYSTIFDLSLEEAQKYISEMLLEEIDGCELSISSFIIAEKDGIITAAAAAWIEGIEGIPSIVLKGNLLNYTLPQEAIEKGLTKNNIIREIHIEYIPETIQLGLVYVSSNYRGLNLVGLLIDKQVSRLRKIQPKITEMYVQVFDNNIPAIKSYTKANFNVLSTKESTNKEILHFLPSNKKILMKKDLFI